MEDTIPFGNIESNDSPSIFDQNCRTKIHNIYTTKDINHQIGNILNGFVVNSYYSPEDVREKKDNIFGYLGIHHLVANIQFHNMKSP